MELFIFEILKFFAIQNRFRGFSFFGCCVHFEPSEKRSSEEMVRIFVLIDREQIDRLENSTKTMKTFAHSMFFGSDVDSGFRRKEKASTEKYENDENRKVLLGVCKLKPAQAEFVKIRMQSGKSNLNI